MMIEYKKCSPNGNSNLPLIMNNKQKKNTKLSTTARSSSKQNELTLAIQNLIDYKTNSEARWYEFLKQQSDLESKRRQEDLQYQLQLLQLIINAFPKTQQQQQQQQQQPQQPQPQASPFLTVLHQLLNNGEVAATPLPTISPNENTTNVKKRKSSSINSLSTETSKIKKTMNNNNLSSSIADTASLYNLMAQIYNINNTGGTNDENSSTL